MIVRYGIPFRQMIKEIDYVGEFLRLLFVK